jgi:hypothetical protein
MCFIRPSWLDIRIPNRFIKSKASYLLEVYVKEATRLFVGVHQRDRRGLTNDDPDRLYSAFLLTVVGFTDGGGWDAITQSHEGTFWRGRDTFLDLRFEPNTKPYFIIPRRYGGDGPKDTVLSVLVENKNAVTIALREPSEEVIHSLRFSPILKFDPSTLTTPTMFECQLNRVAKTDLGW